MKVEDKTKSKPRSRLDTIDHYAGIAVLAITGTGIVAVAWWLIATWPRL